MKKTIIISLLLTVLSILFGCMDPPVERDLKEAENIKESEQLKSNTTEEKNIEYLSVDEALKKLAAKEIVYVREISPVPEMPVVGWWDGKNISNEYRSKKDMLIEQLEFRKRISEMNRNIIYDSANSVQNTLVYKIDLENGKYLALAEITDQKAVNFTELLTLGKQLSDIPEEPFPSPENSRVVAIIEKCGYDAEAKNPASNIADADKKSVGIIEAAEALAAGHSVRLSDIRLPGDATLFASALIADPEKGEQLKNKNGLVILDEFTAKEFRESTDGNVLAAEIGVIYNENGYDKKAMIYAYLPTEALDDCLKVNAETISESSFVSKYADQAAVYSITDYRNNRVLFYDDSIISSNLERMAQ